MNCPTCQAALPEDAAFCGHCGGALRSERTCARRGGLGAFREELYRRF
jgi:predicted amidophosphoribosyltransferase